MQVDHQPKNVRHEIFFTSLVWFVFVFAADAIDKRKSNLVLYPFRENHFSGKYFMHDKKTFKSKEEALKYNEKFQKQIFVIIAPNVYFFQRYTKKLRG